MTLILVIIGLILLLAGSGWFAGAATVGIILAIAGVVGIVIQVAIMGSVLKMQKNMKDNFFR